VEIRAYVHPFEKLCCRDLEELGDMVYRDVPLSQLRHIAADLDADAENAWQTCCRIMDRLIERKAFIAYVEQCGDSEMLARLHELSRVDQVDYEFMRALSRRIEAQQSHAQQALFDRDPDLARRPVFQPVTNWDVRWCWQIARAVYFE
jgi:hypothetical protein